MDSRLLEMCSAAALAGLCASPNHPAGAHPTNGDTDKVVDRAVMLGAALAQRLTAARESARRHHEPAQKRR